MSRKEKILIVEPSFIVTEGLTRILKDLSDFEILPPLEDMDDFRERLAAVRPDILLINPTILPYTKRPAVFSLLQDYPQMTVVALVYQYIDSAVLHSFHGILEIREVRERIADILTEAQTSASTHKLPMDATNYELTKRETDVLVLVAKGLMSKEIADRLHISVHTVISHRKNITRKTNIKSVAGLAMYALMNNLVEEDTM